jgi:hypothetical protein
MYRPLRSLQFLSSGNALLFVTGADAEAGLFTYDLMTIIFFSLTLWVIYFKTEDSYEKEPHCRVHTD